MFNPVILTRGLGNRIESINRNYYEIFSTIWEAIRMHSNLNPDTPNFNSTYGTTSLGQAGHPANHEHTNMQLMHWGGSAGRSLAVHHACHQNPAWAAHDLPHLRLLSSGGSSAGPRNNCSSPWCRLPQSGECNHDSRNYICSTGNPRHGTNAKETLDFGNELWLHKVCRLAVRANDRGRANDRIHFEITGDRNWSV